MRCWHCGEEHNTSALNGPAQLTCRCGKRLTVVQPTVGSGYQLPNPTPMAAFNLTSPEEEGNGRTVHAGGYIGGFFMVLVGLGLAVWGGYEYRQSEQAEARMRTAEGPVVKIVPNGRSVDATVQFAAEDGKSYEGTFTVSSSTRPGDRLELLYDPDDPHINRIGTSESLYGFAYAGMGMGAIVFLLGLYSVCQQSEDDEKYRETRDRDLTQNGSPFPPTCAKCANNTASGLWPVYGETTVVEAPGVTVHNTPFIDVPICTGCRWQIYFIYGLVTLVGLAVGGGTFSFIFFRDGDVKTLAAAGVLAGVFAGAIAAVIAQLCVKNIVSLGKFDADTSAVHFKNPRYQQLYFEHLNHGFARGAPARSRVESMLDQ